MRLARFTVEDHAYGASRLPKTTVLQSRVAVRADIGSMSVWLPLLSACNLQSLTPMFFASFFLARLIYIARYVLGSLKC